MGIKIIHGNADLVGDAFRGLGEGADKLARQQNVDRELGDREERTRVIQQEADRRTTAMEERLAMDQEAHELSMREFNKRMLEAEARQTFRGQAGQLAPDQFDAELELLSRAGLSPEDEVFERQRIETDRQAHRVEQVAMGKRAAIRQMIQREPELVAATPTLAALADGTIDLEAMSPEEVHETYQIAEQEMMAAQDERQDLLAYQRSGQYLDKVLANPDVPLSLSESLPAFIRSAGLGDNPKVLERFLAGLAGDVPMASLYDGGPTEAVLNQWSLHQRQQRFAQTPEGRAAIQAQAAADAGNMGLGGGGVSRGTSQVDAAQLMNEAPQSLSPRERAAVYAKIDADDAMVAEARAAAESSGRKLLADVPLERRREIMRDFYDEFPERLAELSPDEELQAIGEYLASKGVEPHPGVVQHVAQWLTYTPEQFTATLDAMSDSPGEDPRIQEFKAYREGRADQRKKRKERVEAERAAEQQDVLNQIRALGLTEE